MMHILRKTSGLALGMVTVFALAACGHDPKHLDRDFAKELLTNVVTQKPLTIDLITAEASAGDKQKSALSFGQSDGDGTPEGNILVKAGLLILRYHNSCPGITDCYDPKYVLTATGRRLAANWQVVSKKGGATEYAVPVGAEQIGVVTGIQQVMDASHSEVSFDCTTIPNDLGRKLMTISPPLLIGAPFGNRISLFGKIGNIYFQRQKQQCTTDMTLYDDGWRVGS